MRAVIYSKDFEPITVVNLPVLPEQITRYMGDRIALPIFDRSKMVNWQELACPPAAVKFKTVTLTMEKMRWRDGSTKWIFVADCDENALLLDPAWLPGQQGEINRMDQERSDLAGLLLAAIARNMPGGRGL